MQPSLHHQVSSQHPWHHTEAAPVIRRREGRRAWATTTTTTSSTVCRGAGGAENLVQTSTRPAKTCSEAVLRARQALRTLRDARPAPPPPTPQQGTATAPQPGSAAALAEQAKQQVWVTVELPLPVKASLLTSAGVSGDGDAVRASDEGDWPGGMQQRFRVLRPLVEALLEGYDWRFLGLLESDADGVGLWSTPDMTIIGSVTNPTFSTFIKLLEGGYGSRVTQPGHIVLAVNPQWTRSKDMGQPWDRGMRAKAAAILCEDSPKSSSPAVRGVLRPWLPVYACRMVRGSRGSLGLLHRAWPGPWQVYATPLDDAREVGPLVLQSEEEPTSAQVVEALQGSRDAMQARAQEIQEEEKRARGGGWPWG